MMGKMLNSNKSGGDKKAQMSSGQSDGVNKFKGNRMILIVAVVVVIVLAMAFFLLSGGGSSSHHKMLPPPTNLPQPAGMPPSPVAPQPMGPPQPVNAPQPSGKPLVNNTNAQPNTAQQIPGVPPPQTYQGAQSQPSSVATQSSQNRANSSTSQNKEQNLVSNNPNLIGSTVEKALKEIESKIKAHEDEKHSKDLGSLPSLKSLLNNSGPINLSKLPQPPNEKSPILNNINNGLPKVVRVSSKMIYPDGNVVLKADVGNITVGSKIGDWKVTAITDNTIELQRTVKKQKKVGKKEETIKKIQHKTVKYYVAF